jgi:DNA (cytosine-5)-methyltransferase 1
MEKTICELFAGVGGFRLGFEKADKDWDTVWFSQWEPGRKQQWAHDCYTKHFGDSIDKNGEYTTGIDIAKVNKKSIPDHNLLVGGFPCQDYSVAHGLSGEKGIQGKKGVMWWQIRDTLIAKKPSFCLFENVDRLLKSPSIQKGRDFGIILSCLDNLGYSVEWRIINAASYGGAQKRKRTFIFAYKNSTRYNDNISEILIKNNILSDYGFFAKIFPVEKVINIRETKLEKDTVKISCEFSFDFGNVGYLHEGKILTGKAIDLIEDFIPLKDILEPTVSKKYYIAKDKIEKWKYMKGSKKINRTAKNGHKYVYSEGKMSFPDSWENPGRTMLTSESTLNRSTHVVEDLKTKQLRLLTPLECERLQGFDDNWTKTDMPERFRYFCMGNALVVTMITRISKEISNIFEKE